MRLLPKRIKTRPLGQEIQWKFRVKLFRSRADSQSDLLAWLLLVFPEKTIQCRGSEVRGRQARSIIHHRGSGVLLEAVRQARTANGEGPVKLPGFGQVLQYAGPEAAAGAFLDSDQQRHDCFASLRDQLDVEWLGRIVRRPRSTDRPRALGECLLPSRHSPRRVPKERNAMYRPSRTIRPLPISNRNHRAREAQRRFPRHADIGRRSARLSWAVAVATICTSSASSAAAITVKPGRFER
jgi:hypothetical protein